MLLPKLTVCLLTLSEINTKYILKLYSIGRSYDILYSDIGNNLITVLLLKLFSIRYKKSI